jgi:L-lysine 2,3-aminomutase
MLNQLVRKHPGVRAIYPMHIEDALSRRLFTPGQFEIVTILLKHPSELPNDTIGAIESIASRGVIMATGDVVEVRATSWPPQS